MGDDEIVQQYISEGRDLPPGEYLVTKTVNVRDFGAKGDYDTDDTDAFKRAITHLENGA